VKLKRFLKITTAAVVAVTGLSVGIAHAANRDEVISGVTNHSVYVAGNNIAVNGIVNGDVFCAGQTVTIDATVNGDVLCAGQDINVRGRINGNARLGGQTVTLGATVSRSVSVAGQSVAIESSASVGQDLTLFAQTASVNGRVNRDLTGAVSSAMLGGVIGRNVSIRSSDLTLDGGTSIAGDLAYTSQRTLHRKPCATVTGMVTYHNAQTGHHGVNFIWAKLYWMAAIAVFGVVLVALFPRAFHRWTPDWGSGFWWALLTGFIAMFAVPVVSIVLMLTVIGVPLGIVLLLLWMIAAFIAMALSSYFIGNLIVPQLHPVLIVFIGGIILGLVELVPVLGWINGLIAYWVGSGVLLRGLRAQYQKPVYGTEK
jgi:hypothetical protein